MNLAVHRGGRTELRRYADAIAMWLRGFDTAAIGEQLELPEHLVARWVTNFREQARQPQ